MHSRYNSPLPLPPSDLSPPALDSFVRCIDGAGACMRWPKRYLIEDKRTRLKGTTSRTTDRATGRPRERQRTPMKPRRATLRLTNSPCLAPSVVVVVPPRSRCAGGRAAWRKGRGKQQPGIFHGLSASRVIMAFGTRSLARSLGLPSLGFQKCVARTKGAAACCANMPRHATPNLTSSRFCHAVQSKHGHLA